MLSLPPNYEIKDGKTFIKSLNRYWVDSQAVAVQLVDNYDNILHSFSIFSECGKFLGVTGTTISNRAKKSQNQFFKFNGKLSYIRKV